MHIPTTLMTFHFVVPEVQKNGTTEHHAQHICKSLASFVSLNVVASSWLKWGWHEKIVSGCFMPPNYLRMRNPAKIDYCLII